MSWDRLKAAAALVDTFTAATAAMTPPPTVHDKPPSTVNAPSLTVSYPTSVNLGGPTFSIDQGTMPVIAAVGVEDGDSLDSLLSAATNAILADNSLGARVQYCNPTLWQNWRILTSAGAQLLVAELVLEIRM